MIEKIELMTKKLTNEFGFICKSYKNDYSCFSNEHEELADRIIELLNKFEEYSKIKMAETEKTNKALKDFFILIVLINDIHYYLQDKKSTKFIGKLEKLMERFNLPFLTQVTENFDNFKWPNQDSPNSRGVVWANNRNYSSDNLFNLFICIGQDIDKPITDYAHNYGHKTIESYYTKHLGNWVNTLGELRENEDQNSIKKLFVHTHSELLSKEKSGFFGCFRTTKIDYNQSLNEFIRHAQESDNRSGQAFINMGLMNVDGSLTERGAGFLCPFASSLNPICF